MSATSKNNAKCSFISLLINLYVYKPYVSLGFELSFVLIVIKLQDLHLVHFVSSPSSSKSGVSATVQNSLEEKVTNDATQEDCHLVEEKFGSLSVQNV